MNCLNCSSCNTEYYSRGKEERVPRVLTGCGHTFCHFCIEQHIEDGGIKCFQCNRVNKLNDSSSFPINETLFSMVRTFSNKKIPICETHNKKLQAYCEKQKALICLECTLSIHRHHKVYLISEKAAADRSALRPVLKTIQEQHSNYLRSLDRLKADEAYLQSSFLDISVEANIFFRNIIEMVAQLQESELNKMRQQKEELVKKIEEERNSFQDQLGFLQKAERIYHELHQASDIQFLQRQCEYDLINIRPKKPKAWTSPILQFKRSLPLQKLIQNLKQLWQLQKKKAQSNLQSAKQVLHGSPSLKKYSKQPAVLQVNLNEQYRRRQPKQNKQKPAKKVISILSKRDSDKQKSLYEKQRLIEAVSSGRSSIPIKQNKPDLKYIRESSIKKKNNNSHYDSLFTQDLDLSQAMASSFMRTSRDSQQSILQPSSIKHSFNSFSLLEADEQIYHFGGRGQTFVEKYRSESNKSQHSSAKISRKCMQAVYHRAYNSDKCLIIGGQSNSNNRMDGEIYEFCFKSQKITKTGLTLSQPRTSFGCISKDNFLYIMGGKNQKQLNTFQQIQISQNGIHQVNRLPNMAQARCQLGFCLALDGFIYVAGGVNHSNNTLNSCQRYNQQKRRWETVAHMHHQRKGFSLVPLPHGIFAIGGSSNLGCHSNVELYDFNRNQWIEMAPMKQPRCYFSAIPSRDYQTIIIFGGFVDNRELDSIQIYDISTNTWSNGGRMLEKRCLHASLSRPY